MFKTTEKLMLLLCGDFNDGLTPLGLKQFRKLSERVRNNLFFSPDKELTRSDFIDLGYDEEESKKIFELISRENSVRCELERLAGMGIFPLTRISTEYPKSILEKLGDSAPMVLFYAGNLDLLKNAAIALVGSREISVQGATFARTLGETAAKSGLTLVSGGANGADIIAQTAALANGGSVICFRPDGLVNNINKLSNEIAAGKLLVITERGADISFSSATAASRNRLIHCYSDRVFVAGSDYKKGGTWSGTETNLKKGYSKVYVFDDGSAGCSGLIGLGGEPIGLSDLDKIEGNSQDRSLR